MEKLQMSNTNVKSYAKSVKGKLNSLVLIKYLSDQFFYQCLVLYIHLSSCSMYIL